MPKRKRTHRQEKSGERNEINRVVLPRPLTLSYDCVERPGNTRPAYFSTRSEDRELTQYQRQLMISEARKQIRNFTMAGFVLRKHLQFVSYYRFSANTPDESFNRELEKRVNRWKRRRNCDASNRFGFDQLIYLIESHRALDGDVGILLLSNGKLQIIEGDRIRTPLDIRTGEKWEHGVKINEYGMPLAYAVHHRNPDGGFTLDRVVNARNMRLLGYYTRKDQQRGIPLAAPAIKQFAYLYESIDLALVKQKLEQVLGLKTTLEEDSSFGQRRTKDERQGEIDRRVVETFGPEILRLDLKVGENAEFIQSNNPSGNFQTFCDRVLQMVFAAYDIPFSFYDGSRTNFYGSRGEFEQFMDSVERKQAPTVEMLNEMTFDWLVPIWENDELEPLDIPNGWTYDDLADYCGWSGAGMPMWRLLEYVKDTQIAFDLFLLSPFEVASSYGMDLKHNIADIAMMKQMAAAAGLKSAVGEEKSVNIGM